MFCVLLFNFVNYVLLLLGLCILNVMYVLLYIYIYIYIYIVSLCCSVYCLCVHVYCPNTTGCQPNCS